MSTSTVRKTSLFPAKFTIDLGTPVYAGGKVSVAAKVIYIGGGLFTDAAAIHLVVVERELDGIITSDNGDDHFEWVMKKMLPNPVGTIITDPWLSGDTVSLAMEWALGVSDTIYDLCRIGVVAFIQENYKLNPAVYQAAYAQANISTGVVEEELASGYDLRVYPVPTSDMLNISLIDHRIDQAELYDVLGKQMKATFPHSSHAILNISGLSDGIYLLKIRSGERWMMRRIEILKN